MHGASLLAPSSHGALAQRSRSSHQQEQWLELWEFAGCALTPHGPDTTCGAPVDGPGLVDLSR